jgi:hypothetical protein
VKVAGFGNGADAAPLRQSATDRRSLPPRRRRRSRPSRAAHSGSAPVGAAITPISARADDPPCGRPLFTQTHRLNTFLQHDLLRGVSNTLVGQASSMRLGPSLPAIGIDSLVTKQKRTQLPARGTHRAHGRLPGADQIAYRLVCRVRHPVETDSSFPAASVGWVNDPLPG